MPEQNSHLLNLLCKNNRSPHDPTLAELYKSDPQRFKHYSTRLNQLMFDYSRTGLNSERLNSLLQLADDAGLDKWRRLMLEGEVVNASEGRPADHSLLRATKPEDSSNRLGKDIQGQRTAMIALGASLHQGVLPGYEGVITDVIHIGIGGSVLGPRLILDALQDLDSGVVRVHFLTSADGRQAATLMKELKPETTAVVVVSKSFSTREIQLNLECLRLWLSASRAGLNPEDQMVAITSQYAVAESAGFNQENILLFPESIGGRFSLWSAVGIPIVVRYGQAVYLELLAGAERMDLHFADTPAGQNLPVLAALISIWHRNVCAYPAIAVVPYDSRLRLLPAWLQQLDMESAGKSVDRDGIQLEHPASPVIFGGSGTDVQHSFFQALYQGMDTIPVEFIGVLNNDSDEAGNNRHNRFQLANLIGQADALAFASQSQSAAATSPEPDPHRQFNGNRPSTVMLLDSLDAGNLGELLAFYEHRVFVQSVIWGNNPFDQFGVEFGKQLAEQVEEFLQSAASGRADVESTDINSLHHWVAAKLRK